MNTISFKMILLTSVLAFLNVGCDEKIEFDNIVQQCAPPASSARFGANPGPIIEFPVEEQPANGTITVKGTCEPNITVTLKETGSDKEYSGMCSASGRFEVTLNFTSGDGLKDISAAQNSVDGDPVLDRRCFVQDTVPPAVAINDSPSSLAAGNTPSRISGTCEAGLEVIISGPSVKDGPITTSCPDGTFDTAIELEGPDGLKDVVAVQTDPAGNNGDDTEEYLKDTTPPIVSIDSPAEMTLTTGTLTVTGQCETGLSVVLQGDGISGATQVECNSGTFSKEIQLSNNDGVKNIVASQTDSANNYGDDNRDFMKDSTAPSIAISSPTMGSYVNTTSTIEGTCETGLNVTLSSSDIQTPVTTNCNLGSFSANVNWTAADGPKVVFAKQTDQIGNSSQAMASYLQDSTPPAITITSPANNSYADATVTVSGTCESGLNVTLNGTGVATAVNTMCNSGNFSSTVSLSSGDGNKTIVASQTDANNNSAQDSVSVLRDTTAPTLTIEQPTENSYIGDTFTLSGACESGLTVNVSGNAITANTTTNCNNNTYSILLNSTSTSGTVNVAVAQTDAKGNTATASRSLIRDLAAPVVQITNPSENSYIKGNFSISGTCEDGFDVTLSGDAITSNVTTNCNAGQFTANATAAATDGNKTLTATQTDQSGNTGSSSITLMVDNTAPVVAITAPANNTKINNTSQTITGTCESDLPVIINGAGVDTPTNINCNNGTFSTTITLVAGEGAKEVIANQTDLNNNSGSDTITLDLDLSGPNLTIATPTENQIVGATTIVSGTCESGHEVNLSGSALATGTTATCSSSNYSTSINIVNQNGALQIIATQQDSLGNSTTVTRNISRDLEAPQVTITSPAQSAVIGTNFTVAGTCEDGLNVSLTGDLDKNYNVNCNSGTFTANVSTSTGDGSKTITASQTDTFGNTGADSKTYTADTTAPVVAITSPSNGSSTASTSVLVSGTCETGLEVNLSGSGLATNSTSTCSSATFSANITLTSGDGSKTITASQTDAIGNTASDSISVTLDTTAPTLTINTPTENQVVGATITVSGNCESGQNVSLSGSALASPSTVSCTSSSYSTTINVANQNGALQIIASQQDALGNSTTVTRNISRDLVAPTVAISSPAQGDFIGANFTVTGTCEDGLNVSLTGDLDKSYNTNCSSGAFSASVLASRGDGSKTITATQTDSYGNTGSDSKTYTADTTPPNLTITSPVKDSYTANANITIAGACESGLPVIITSVELSSSITVNCTSGSYSTPATITSGDGNKVIVANQTDNNGNNTSASTSFNLDTTAPVVNITSPSENSYHNDVADISGTCESGLTVTLSGTGITSTVNTSCTSGTFNTSVDLTASESLKNIIASQTDAVGNTGSDFVNIYNDETAPIVTIENPAAGTSAQTGLTISGNCETGLDVTISGSGSLVSKNVSCTSGTYSTFVDFSIGDGSKLIKVAQVDQAGNAALDTRSFVRDNTAPNLTITSPAANSYQSGSVTVSGACETGYDVTLSGNALASTTTTSCSSSSYSQSVTLSNLEGTITITATQADQAGNSATANRSINQDLTAPTVTIDSPSNSGLTEVSQTVSGQCESGYNVTVSGDVTSSQTASCSGGSYSVNVTLTGVNGNKTLMASQTDAAGNTGTDSRAYTLTTPSTTETFVSQGSNGKVDILFIDDNSASMETEQQALGTKFSSFSSELSTLDWQIGITTTDCSSGAHGICGTMLNFPHGSHILTSSVTDYVSEFNNTIQRPETFDCILSGTCPSGNEEALLASMTAMDKRSSDNTGFFRSDVQLAIVVLSDEDEQSDGKATATTPTEMINHFKSIWPSNKVMSVYGIIVQPGDSSCLSTQQAQFGGSGNYGTFVDDLAAQTKGFTVSICAPDYSTTLKSIGENVRKLTTTYELEHTPKAGTVSVTFTPSHSTTFTLDGNRITLDTPPPAGTTIQFSYEY